MEDELPSQDKNVINVEKEVDNSKNYKLISEDSDFITEENLLKIKRILLYLDNHEKYKEKVIKNDIECLYSQINNYSMKERVVLDTMLSMSKSENSGNKAKFLEYKDTLENNHEEDEFDIDKKIFIAVDRVAHKTLHKDKNEKNNNKICQIYKDLKDYEFKESEKSIGYNNIDKLINSLKEKHPYIEFIAIKAIIVSMMNITQELINNYYKTSEELNLNLNVNIINEDNDFYDDEETEIIEINSKIFDILFNDYIFISNRCSFLENYFIESFNNFRTKYKMEFTLSNLFTDIFWNKIFHNKALCKKFINIYIGNDTCSDDIKKILYKIIKIISDISLPIKIQILKLLSLNDIENEEIDLISSIITQKNINHDLLKNERIINNITHISINPEELTDKNIINNKIEVEQKEEKKEEEKEKSENKEKNEKIFSESEMENKTVDEIYNYINDNNNTKTKKKKKNKKKKNKKNEIKINTVIEEKKVEEDFDDDIINKFKQDILKNMIDANSINKIKPVVSEKFLELISHKY